MAQSLSANLSYKENVNVAYDNSFVLINNNVRPLYAQATYLANASDISVSLNAGSLSIDLTNIEDSLDRIESKLDSQMGKNGFDFIDNTAFRTGTWTTLTVLSAAKISSIGVVNSLSGNIKNYILPASYTISGSITSIQLTYGAVILYK